MPQTITYIYDQLCTVTEPKNARWVMEIRSGITWGDLINTPDKVLPKSQVEMIQTDIENLKNGATIARVLGVSSFYGRDFVLSDATLEPRADSEVLIDAVLECYKAVPPLTICDYGTGTGCLLITLLKEYQSATGIGVDINIKACEVARNNAHIHNVQNRAQFLCVNWVDGIQSQFDCIISNPPYIVNDVVATLNPSVKDFDPYTALAGGQDGCDPYRILFPALHDCLTPNGRAFFEIGYDQADTLTLLARDNNLIIHALHSDSGGRDRCLEISRGDK